MVDRGQSGHPIVDHYDQDHPGIEKRFEMKILKFVDKNLYRQAEEGHRIQNFKGDKILNGRGDWGQNLPPRLEIEGKRAPPPPHQGKKLEKIARGGGLWTETTPPSSPQYSYC